MLFLAVTVAKHRRAQNRVQSAVIALTLAFQPFDHVGINPHG